MRKNKNELFDKETMEMFEKVNKASEEETKKELQEVQDRKDEIKFKIALSIGIIIFIGLFALLSIINQRNYDRFMNSCIKNGNSYNYCQQKAM